MKRPIARLCLCLVPCLGLGAPAAPPATAGSGAEASAPAPSADPLVQGFRDPPREFSQVAFWSWNGKLEPERLRSQIDEMVDKGIYGAFLHARVGLNLDSTPYFSEGWWKAIEASVEHGAAVGFATWLYDEDQWPSGAAGGRTIQANPQRNTRKGLRTVELRVRGPAEVPLRIARAIHVVAGKVAGDGKLEPGSLVEVTEHNVATLHSLDTSATRGLRVVIISDAAKPLLAPRCRELGCAVTELRTQQAGTVRLEATDVLVSDVDTLGTTLPREALLEWIRKGGGLVDFSHSEPTDGLFDVTPVVEPDVPGHRWLQPDHPIASVPNPDPDSSYTGKRWSDQWWRGGRDFEDFEHVLADTRHDPPGISVLARSEGKGRVVLCGATQACREEEDHLELLQNILTYAAGREGVARKAPPASSETRAPWKCPEGEWLVIGYLPDNNPGTEAMPAVNYMNRDTVRDFIDITYEEYARRVGKHFGTTIPGVFFDEIHNSAVQIVWVESFAEEFRKRKGYDLIPLLPALSHDIGPLTPKVRCDYHDVYTAIYEDAWFRQIAEWCGARNLMLTGHTVEDLDAYRTQGSYYRTIRHLQIPGTDNEDYRYRYPRRIDPWKPKQLASISHLYGRPLAGVEAMGGAGWQFTLESARHGFNVLAAYGMNFFVPHLFHYAQDRPENVDDWPNSWFLQNPYWKYYKTFADHSRRLSYMLTGGEHVADVAVLHPITNLWAGEGGGTTQKTVELLVAAQIDCDVIDPDSLVRAEIQGGALTVSGNRYLFLVLPGVKCVRRSAAAKIREFIAAGGVVIVHDRWPTDSMDAGRDDPEIGRLRDDGIARGISPVRPQETVGEVSERIERDLVAKGPLQEALRYHHVRREGREVYFLVNDSGKRLGADISFRATGTPEIWNPEDGSVRPLTAHTRDECGTDASLVLDGGQGAFVVIDTRKEPAPLGASIASTELEDLEVVSIRPGGLEVSGLLAPEHPVPSVAARIHGPRGVKEVSGRGDAPAPPATIELEGPWTFLPAAERLDREWTIDQEEVELSLPVMSYRWEHDENGRDLGWQKGEFDHSGWRQIKVLDTLHPEDGAHRYRSRWEGRFISWYEYAGFHTRTGGAGLRCRKTFRLDAPQGSGGGSPSGTPPGGSSPGAAPADGTWKGWLAVVADGPFRLKVGDLTFSGQGGVKPEKIAIDGLRPGESTILVETDASRAILVEGLLAAGPGKRVRVATDPTWEVSLDGKAWRPAWEYVAPPEKPYGEPEYPEPRPVPVLVWYRRILPPGVTTVLEPRVEGRWRAWVDGQTLFFLNGEATIEPKEGRRVLALRVRTEDESQRALVEPFRVRCRPAAVPLGSWTALGLEGYSGRALYSTTFSLSPAHVEDGVRLRLDLGRVAYCAEIWLNGKLAGTRVWPPYRLDITKAVTVGENRLTVVVANLLANRMQWDIFDDVKGVEWNRKWHDGNIRRDAWCLESGLLGPARVVPLREVRLTAR